MFKKLLHYIYHDKVQIHAPGVPFVNCHFKGLQGDTQVKL